ncbi:MAG: AbrB/MazE/SpoVT family DNA-binding domain-containing protein [Candidatus Eiseniibacteriota bacterium]
MKAKVVRIGNSKGIRLPKPLLEQVGLTEEVELEVRDGAIVITPGEQARRGWAQAAQAVAARGEDQLLDAPIPTEFDREEWDW